MNADLLVKAGAAINLLDKPRKLNNMNIDFDTATTYREPAFTAQIVYEKINEILTNPRYKIGITKLSIQANAAGGRELALNADARPLHFLPCQSRTTTLRTHQEAIGAEELQH